MLGLVSAATVDSLTQNIRDTMAKQSKDTELIELAKTLQGAPWCEEYEKMISGML